MAEDDTDAGADVDLDEMEEGEEAPRPKSRKLKLFIIIGAALLLLAGTGAGLYFSGLLDSLLGTGKRPLSPDEMPQGKVFYKLENITLNLDADARTPRFLQVGLTLVLIEQDDVAKLEPLVPRITDYVSNYLRGMAPEELESSASFYRVREDLLRRVRAAVAPIPVTDVLFNTVLVQ